MKILKKLTLWILLIIGIFLIWLLFYPAKGLFNPQVFVAPKASPWEGALAPNRALQSAQAIGEGELKGPEELALGPDGKVYTGTADGLVKRFSLEGSVEIFADTGGRPAGLDFDRDGNLYVAVGYRGLMKITPEGNAEIVSDKVGDLFLDFVDGVEVGEDGIVYFTLASSKYSMHEWMFDFFESAPNGKLLAYDPTTQKTEVLVETMYFPNGIAYLPGGDYLLVSETSSFRIMRYWLKGEKAGTVDVFVENMPGFPDGLSFDAKGNLMVSLSSKRTKELDWMLKQPGPIKNAFVKLLPFIAHKLERYAFYLIISPYTGEFIESYHDPDGSVSTVVTSTLAYGDKILIGSFEDSRVLIIDQWKRTEEAR